MAIDRKRAIKVAFAASVALSVSIFLTPLLLPQTPIWSLLVANWLAFQAVGWLYIQRRKVPELSYVESVAWDRMMNVALIAFTVLGLASFGMGARLL